MSGKEVDVRREYDWGLAEKFDRAVGLFLKFMGILTALVAMNFFVPTANVVVSSVGKSIKIEEQVVEERYEGVDVPQEVRDTIKRYNEGTLVSEVWVLSPIWETAIFEWPPSEVKSAFVPRPEGEDWADWFSNFYSQTGYCDLVEDPGLCEDLLESVKEDPRLRAYDLLSEQFEPAEVAPIWARVLVFRKDLSDEEISLALDALSEAQYLSVTVVVENQGKANAENVQVKAIDHFQSLDEKDDERPALEWGQKQAFYFRGEVGKNLGMSENELRDLFDPSWTTAAPPGQLLNTEEIRCWTRFFFVVAVVYLLCDALGGILRRPSDSQEKPS